MKPAQRTGHYYPGAVEVLLLIAPCFVANYVYRSRETAINCA